MARSVANVATASDTFEGWINKTNILLGALTTYVITVSQTSANGDLTTGNAFVNGILSSTTLSTDFLRGGNVQSYGALVIGFSNSTISSNVRISGYQTQVGNTTAPSNTSIYSQNTYVILENMLVTGNSSWLANVSYLVDKFEVGGNTFTINSDSSVFKQLVTFQSNLTSSGFILANNITAAGNVTINGASVNVATGTLRVGGITTLVANLNAQGHTNTTTLTTSGNTSLTGVLVTNTTLITASVNVAVDTNVLFVDVVNNRVGIGNTAPGSTLTLDGTFAVTGNVAIDTTTFVIDTTNNRLGINTAPSATEVLAVRGDTRFYNTLTVEGDLQVNGALTFSGIANGDFTPGTDDTYNLGNTTNRWLGWFSNLEVANNAFFGNSTVTSLFIEVGASANVGIGTQTPNAKLQVVGTANVSGNVVIGGRATISGNVITAVIGPSATSQHTLPATANATVVVTNGTTAFSSNQTFSGTAPIISAGAGSSGTTQHAFPAVANSTFAVLAAVQTFTSNTTFSGALLTLSGTNTAVTGTSFNVAANANFTANLTASGAYVYRVGGTDILLADGGTGASLTAAGGGLIYSNASSFAVTSSPTVGQIVLTGNSTVHSPTFVTTTLGVVTNATHIYVSHDATSGYDANDHIDHSTVSITAGNGLSGGGTIAATRSLAVLANNGIIANSTGVFVKANTGIIANTTGVFANHDAALNYDANDHIDHTTVSITAGNGLTGGGTIATTRTLTVLANTGLVANATGVFVNAAYLATQSSNNASYLGGVPAAGYVSNTNPSYVAQTLTANATHIDWNADLGGIASYTLTGNRIMSAPTNLKIGIYVLHLYQDGTGSRTISSWNSVFKFVGGVAPTISTVASSHDIFTFVCDGTNLFGGAMVGYTS